MNTTRKQKRGPLLSPPPQAGEEIARHAKHKARRARRNDETARARPLSRPPAPAGEEAVSRAGLLRGLNSAWLFWTVCAEKSCRRARACAGDPDACFARSWPHVPEELKVRLRTFIKSRVRGASVQQAWREAEAEAARVGEGPR
jgi:hypothetical protein